MHPARPEDASAIESFLAQHSEATMFLRDNLREYGPCGGQGDRATRMWIKKNGGRIDSLVGISNAGSVFSALNSEVADPVLKNIFVGERVSGIVGLSAQVATVRRALGLEDAPTRRDVAEPHFLLELTDLVLPPGNATLRLARDADAMLLAQWRADYLREVFSMPAQEAVAQGRAQVLAMIECERLAVLELAGKPISMTAFNAVMPDIVQVGNVYTPPSLRGRHYARRAVALHLEMARKAGVRRAVLSAADDAASRAYSAIGFRRIGRFSMLLFDAPQKVSLP